MKAAIRTKYGLPGVLSIQEITKPTVKDDEILVRVYAATVNRTDCHILSGKPYFMRFLTGLFKPKLATTGTDFAGQVEATGKNISAYKTGDKLFGFDFLGLSSHAQYLVVPESKVVAMPNHCSYEDAAACIEGAFYALAVMNKVRPAKGSNALVIGATGAIGSAGVQYLKYYEVAVTAVCKGEDDALARSLGADAIINYVEEDFTKTAGRYDFILDAVGKYSFGQCKALLKPGGIFSSSGGIQNILLPFITPLLGGKKVVFAPPKDLKGSLGFIRDLVEKGNFKPVIDRRYPLEKISEAFNYVASGQKKGNVVITPGM